MVAANCPGKVSGFSLVELMVGMVLGLMLIAGAVSVYLASKQSYVEVEQVAALTENARFAEQMLGDSLKHAGFFGEALATSIEVDAGLAAPAGDCASPAGAYDLSRLAFAATADGSGNALGCISDAVPGTDVIVIKSALPRPFTDGPRVGGDPNDPTNSDGVIDTPGPLQAGRTYVMTNNVGGLLFNGSSPPSITLGGDIPNGSAWEYRYEVFYVRDGDVPRLARRELAYDGVSAMVFRTEELAEGVENLRLLFGFDSNSDGDVDSFETVANVTASGNWDDVQSVEVYMLVRSATPDMQYDDAKVYRLGGATTVGPFNDNFRRLISFTSLSIRNMKLMLRGDA